MTPECWVLADCGVEERERDMVAMRIDCLDHRMDPEPGRENALDTEPVEPRVLHHPPSKCPDPPLPLGEGSGVACAGGAGSGAGSGGGELGGGAEAGGGAEVAGGVEAGGTGELGGGAKTVGPPVL